MRFYDSFYNSFYNSVTGLAGLLFCFWFVVPLGVVGLFDDGVFYGVIARNWVYAADSQNWWQLKAAPQWRAAQSSLRSDA